VYYSYLIYTFKSLHQSISFLVHVKTTSAA
jgi:hypothetical protein